MRDRRGASTRRQAIVSDRDLVDLVVIARTQVVQASQLRTAIEAERLNRKLPEIAAKRRRPAGERPTPGWLATLPSAKTIGPSIGRCASPRRFSIRCCKRPL